MYHISILPKIDRTNCSGDLSWQEACVSQRAASATKRKDRNGIQTRPKWHLQVCLHAV